VVSCRRQDYHRGDGLPVHKDTNIVAIRIGGEHVKELACPLVGRREGNELLSVAEGDLQPLCAGGASVARPDYLVVPIRAVTLQIPDEKSAFSSDSVTSTTPWPGVIT
jgi:hypothetical protein